MGAGAEVDVAGDAADEAGDVVVSFVVAVAVEVVDGGASDDPSGNSTEIGGPVQLAGMRTVGDIDIAKDAAYHATDVTCS